MTEGMIISRNGKKITLAVYLRSDAYPSVEPDSYCAGVIDAYKSGDFVAGIRKNFAHIRKPSFFYKAGEVTRETYVRTSKNQDNFFVDYAYEYDEKKDTLTLYDFGRRAVTFSRDQIPYMDYFFANFYLIADALSFDFDNLSGSFNREEYKTFSRLMQNNTVEEIAAQVSSLADKVQVEIESGQIVDWRAENFLKRVTLYNGLDDKVGSLLFAFDYDKYNSRRPYTIYLQTPSCRMVVDPTGYSKNAALKRLLTLCKDDAFVKNLKVAVKVFADVERLKTIVSDFSQLPYAEQKKCKDEIVKKVAMLWRNADEHKLSVCNTSEKALYGEAYERLLRVIDKAESENKAKTAV